MNNASCPMCGQAEAELLFLYAAPPPGEIRFASASGGSYRRRILRCPRCGHCRSEHDMDLSELYASDYVTSNYRDADGIRRMYERIISLPAADSDNAGRVARVVAYAGAGTPQAGGGPPYSVLDIGSGLGVFLRGMKAAGWVCTGMDADDRLVEHARSVVGVTAVKGNFSTTQLNGHFHAITFNKVIEHVPDPIAFLARARALLAPEGFIYAEVPDAEAAAESGSNREEFFIDHWHVFSAASLVLLTAAAGLRLDYMRRLREPSGKFTIYAFLSAPRPDSRESASDD